MLQQYVMWTRRYLHSYLGLPCEEFTAVHRCFAALTPSNF
jgi:hypothetical protein